MAREQKSKSKASQANNARSKPRVAPTAATLVPNPTQTTAATKTSETSAADDTTTTDPTDAAQGGASVPSTQSATSNQQVVWTGLQPTWPTWPTSKPGPRSTSPAPGMHPINAFRPEQFENVGYDQQRGEPTTQRREGFHAPPGEGFHAPPVSPVIPIHALADQHPIGPTSVTAQEALGKRKQRL